MVENFGTYDIEKIKTISIRKKTSGDFVFTPIHCSCINPSSRFLEYFMD